ncbi:hypothetical protein [Streptomyces sp. LaPpAH-108]|uniref:hypothetical protein n=1 Tax=Streptomyces sp. LaPpAH-108 TaxID=1155714 RepID=UPI0003A3D0A8|nr:hypothetical protein [Streptomyces sp. LaPpAH-108]
MSEQDATAGPGIAPTSLRTAGTMFAALYGESDPYPWHDPGSEHDAYQLFYQRSLAMGWLDERAGEGEAPGLWGMNDAGWGHPRDDFGTDLVSWFQVEASAVADDRPLPVQPFLRCAWDVTVRLGVVRLGAVQVLLPVQGVDAGVRPPQAAVPSLGTVDWFGEGDPGARAVVTVRVDSGQDPAVSAVGPQLVSCLGQLDQGLFGFRADGAAAPDPAPPFDDSFWNGPSRHALTLRGELPEWSCDAVGWVAETVADCAARLGVRTPLLLTVTRN